MRYFIYYPPTKSSKRIDVVDGTRVQEIIDVVQREFGLKVDTDSQAKASIVLNYNGADLKPTWNFADLNIPPGTIIRCLYRKKKAADLYVHCGFNSQILEVFDDTITNETTIGEIRKKISDRIGLPLSTFCLETKDIEQRLYDHMKLFQYDLKPHDHIYLKVWLGYEDFLNSCMRGIPKRYSNDDLTRHYQLQIALHVAAFYGFMELGNSALQLGARSDYPVGEHPSRQWSSETTVQDMSEMLKCPIHIAIERGHMKMVDLFVTQSLFCTQITHPISGFLPYRIALSLSILQKTKAEKQRYSQIYLYLYDKQFNRKIKLNANGGNRPRLSTLSTSINSLNRSSGQHVFFSLPRYCKIIRWYQRARELVWKKYGVPIDSSVEIKRAYQSKGLLGYKVLIDGFNNTFDASNKTVCSVASGKKSQIDTSHRYSGYTDDEREKIIKMKAYMKQSGVDERQRAKSTVSINLQKSRHPPLLAQHGLFGAKTQPMSFAPTNPSELLEGIVSLSEYSNASSIISMDHQRSKFIGDTDRSLNIHKTQSAAVKPDEDQHGRNRKAKTVSQMICKTAVSRHISPPVSVVHKKEEPKQQENYTLPRVPTSTPNAPTVESTWQQKLKIMVTNMTSNRQDEMSSADAFLLSSSRIAAKDQQQKIAAKHELLTQIEQSLKTSVEKPKTRSPSVQANRSMILDIDHHIPLPDHQTGQNSRPVRSRLDREIQQATIKSYNRHTSTSARTTAVNCLQEATFFKRKSWVKQVEISKEMVKQRTKRCIREADNGESNSVLSPMRTIGAAPSSCSSGFSTGKAN